jgi:hypothetical protein
MIASTEGIFVGKGSFEEFDIPECDELLGTGGCGITS